MPAGELAERLRRRAGHARLAVDPETAQRLAAYVTLLLRWNERMNLTALDDCERGIDRLVIEPLLAARRIPSASRSLIDVGSGSGSPAIPIRIARPDLFLRMVEAKARKAAFLREAVRRLDLDGTVVEGCRYEKLRERSALRGAHDVLTIRGVRLEKWAAGRLQEFVRPGGMVLIFCAAGQPGPGLVSHARLRMEERIELLEASGSELVVIRKARTSGE